MRDVQSAAAGQIWQPAARIQLVAAGGGVALELVEDFAEALAFVRRDTGKELGLGIVVDAGALFAHAAPEIGNHRAPTAFVERIGLARDEAIRLEPIDQLRDVRLHAGETIGELPEGQYATGVFEALQRGEFGNGQTDFSQLGVDKPFERSRRAQERENTAEA